MGARESAPSRRETVDAGHGVSEKGGGTMRVTAKQLEGEGACEDQIDLFRETFPRGCVVTAANIRKAARAGLNLGWWAEQFLPAPALRAYQEIGRASCRERV